MVANVSETSTAISKKDVVKQGMNYSKSYKNYELYWLHLIPLLLYNNSLKMLILLNYVNFYL